MSEEKVNDSLQDDSEVAVEVESGTTPEEILEAEEQGGEVGRDLEKELTDAQKEIEDLRDKMLRAAAENENFKKRMERERLASLKYAGETIFREILPVVDNLERAVSQGVIEGVPAEQNLAALLEGVQLTLKSVIGTLEKFEVKSVESVGKPFDPKHQEALTMAESDTIPANHVVSEFEKGYYYKDRLLRAAKVVVSSGKKDEESKG
ncbi:MAG: nucleotide exchange factor GrpE [Desulforhopalus sp.]